MKEKIKALKQHYYICYALLFIVMCIVVFGVFWYNGKSFIWGDDTSHDGLMQHYTAYVYYGRYLRTILKSIFIDHSFSIPTFSMSIGYGSDILTTLSYYVIGDPICALTVFVPTKYMIYFYNFSVLLRLYLSGLSFSNLCLYIDQKKDKKFSKTAVIVGTFIFVFCGFALYASVRHPYFINPMIYFPLVLLGIEMILDKKKPYVFTLAVSLSAVSNFYFFYMTVILTILYVVWRLLFKYHKNELKEAVCSLGKITGFSVIGTAMSAVILIPVIILFIGDARGDSGYLHSLLYDLSSYQQTISGFVAVNSGHDWLYMGYAAVALLAVFLLFMQREKYRDVKVAFIGMVVMMMIPLVGEIMNGYSYATNRWIWAFSLLIGYIVVIMWDKLLRASYKEKLGLLLLLCGYFVVCMVMTKSRTVDFFIPMVIAFAFLCLLLLRNKKYQTIITVSCIFCVFANIAVNALLMYSPRFNDYISEFSDEKGFNKKYSNTEAVTLNKLTEIDEEDFSRYTGSVTSNRTLDTGLHSTQFYWSFSNGNINDFQMGNDLNFEISFKYSGLDSRTSLSTLANVGYYVKKNDGSDQEPYGYNYKGSDKKYTIFENENALPFGYTYSNSMTRETYDNLSSIQKQEAMLQAVVLETDDNTENIDDDLVYTSNSLSYTIENTDGVQCEDNKFIVTKGKGTITLTFDGMKNAETYLYINGLTFEGTSPMNRYTDTEWESKSVYDQNAIKYQERFWKEPTQVEIDFSSKDTEDEEQKTSIKYYTPYYTWYSNQHDYLVNLYYDELPRTSITITFQTIGTYTYEDLEVLCQPMDDYEEQVALLKKDTLTNVDFHDDNTAFATNEITGEIQLDQSKYLLLTIPYSSGWTAIVDGKEQELLQANTMYMALKLEAGNHSITLEYHTPGGMAGLCISIISFAIFVFIYIYTEIGKKNSIKRKRKNEEINQ